MKEIEIEICNAKTKFSKLITHVQNGASVTITRHGKPVARLVPALPATELTVSKTLDAIAEFRNERKLKLAGLSVKEMIYEGRR